MVHIQDSITSMAILLSSEYLSSESKDKIKESVSMKRKGKGKRKPDEAKGIQTCANARGKKLSAVMVQRNRRCDRRPLAQSLAEFDGTLLGKNTFDLRLIIGALACVRAPGCNRNADRFEVDDGNYDQIRTACPRRR